jgi:hypothetical protein
MTIKRFSESKIQQMATEDEWEGDGTASLPYIIEDESPFTQQTILKDTSLSIHIKNCSFKNLTLNRCKNIKFTGCIFELLQLLKCSEIQLKNCTFNSKLDITRSTNIHILNSTIQLLYLFLCYENAFEKCKVSQIYNHFSRANTFEQTDTDIQDFDTILGTKPGRFYFWIIGLMIIAILALISTIVVSFNSMNEVFIWSMIGGILLLSFGAIAGTFLLFRDHKKMQNYPPNTII